MLVKYYSIKDYVAEEFGPVFTAKNDGVARRMFTQFLTSKEDEVITFDDYGLYYVFSFDTEHCVVYGGDSHLVQLGLPSEGYLKKEEVNDNTVQVR